MQDMKVMSKDGEFLREYGKTYFAVVAEALNINKVRFSVVPIGKAGQDAINFYLPVEKMVALCDEFVSGKAQQKIANDAEKYPSAYQYVTGEDGALRLSIGGGKFGARIQVSDKSDKSKPLSYLMGVSMEALEAMVFKFRLFTGLIPTAKGTYFAALQETFEDGRNDRAANRKGKGKKTQQPTASEPVQTTLPVDADEPANAPLSGGSVFVLNVNGQKGEAKEFYTFSTDQGTLLFKKAEVANIKWFEAFEKAAAKGTTITIEGEKRGDFILYLGVPKA